MLTIIYITVLALAASFLFALFIGAWLRDCDRHDAEFFGTDDHRWADRPAAAHNNNLAGVVVSIRDGKPC